MKAKYMRTLEQALVMGMKMVDDESVEWDDFMEEVDNMNMHLKVALQILKRTEGEG